jgi:hypothetical protein
MMVKPNKTKPEDYMPPLDVPGSRKQNLPCLAPLKKPVSRVQISAGDTRFNLLKRTLYIRVEA